MKFSKTLKFVTIGLAALAVTIFITLWRAGAFEDVVVQQGKHGGYLLIGADHKGSYQKIGSVFAKVKEAQISANLDSAMFVGVYYDDPGKVEESKLRSFAGFVVKDSTEGLQITKDNPDFHFVNIELRQSYFTELETSGMLSMIIAAVKAYPKLGETITKDRVSPNAQGVAFEEYHNGFTRFVMHVE